ncbi:MAG: hypothetical protein RBG13Loki_3575, partial [Promethearchaeota archaeon CR_4]
MKYIRFAIQLIRMKKAVYYPLFSIFASCSLYGILVMFTDLANNQVIFPFLFWVLATIIVKI